MSSQPTVLRDVYPSEIKTFGGAYARQEMILTGKIGHTWAANYTTALRLPLHPSMGPPNTPYPKDQNENVAGDNHNYVDDHPLSHAALSFVHGGLSPTYSNLAPFPTRINKLSASLLRKSQDRKPLWRPFPEIPPSMSTCLFTSTSAELPAIRCYSRGARVVQ